MPSLDGATGGLDSEPPRRVADGRERRAGSAMRRALPACTPLSEDLQSAGGDRQRPATADAHLGPPAGMRAARRAGRIGAAGAEPFAAVAGRSRDWQDGTAGVPDRVRLG